ncbi:Sialidase precursor [Anatilimnocola aggregata]|uniref:exo-alpha-sialidase n=1 Tax=Anatilimnocola aggregata TaxID=2528021 RepID=A0A517YLF7_9BACT|nr:sialidase family protein [Anatilimnocola aggregata]QDU31040.1 Sialidase precursor [Anatilimnocola aggregata]
MCSSLCPRIHAPLLAILGLLAASFAPAQAAEPIAEPTKIDLFTGGKEGYELFRIPGIIRTGNGTLLAYCEARRSAKGDWGHIDLVARRSTDNGLTWTPMKKLVELEGKFERNPAAVAQKLGREGEITLNNPIAIADPRPYIVHFLYCVEYNRLFYVRSEDDGFTFSKPLELTAAVNKLTPSYAWQALAVGPGHGIRLENGRLLAPVWLSTGKGGHAHRPSIISTIYSDDEGKTWQMGDVIAGETKPLVNPNESILLQLADGRVMINSRSESPEHRRAVSISPDGSTGWSEPKFHDQLLEPICMANLVRWTTTKESDKNRIVFSNPHNLERANAKPGQGRDRKNVSLKLSYDEGATWPVNKTLEAGPSGYSDMAIARDGTLICFYERTTPDEAPNSKSPKLTIARVSLQWLTDGKDQLPQE